MGGAIGDLAWGLFVTATGKVFITGFFMSTPADFDPSVGVFNMTPANSLYDIFVASYTSCCTQPLAVITGNATICAGDSTTLELLGPLG